MSTDKKTDEVTTSAMVERYILAIAEHEKCPVQIRQPLTKAAPTVGKVAEALEKLYSQLYRLYEQAMVQYEKLRPYRLDLLVPSLVGLIMCFFGGSFLLTIAAVEAFRMTGYETTLQCVRDLLEDLKKVKEASDKDNDKDEDGDGVKDVLQISPAALLQRKALLALRVSDPQRLALAIGGINAGFMCVIATLKMQFAKVITLGNAISASLEPPTERYLLPILEGLCPPAYTKWARPMLFYALRAVVISVAWTIQRIISAFHSALRGGLMFSRNILHYLSEMKILHLKHEDTVLDELVGYGVALVGLLWQLRGGFRLPFPLNVLLLPLSILENVLLWAVNNFK
eukprot:gene25734-31080_t